MVKRYTLQDLGGGWDTRDLAFTKRENTARVHENVYTLNSRKPRKRPPVRVSSTRLNGTTQGLIALEGQLYTIAPKGATTTTTAVNGDEAVVVNVLTFDEPDGATGTWTLQDWVVFNGKVCAAIQHDFNSTLYPKWTLLHVFDDAPAPAFTYVADPYAPSEFLPYIAAATDSPEYDSTYQARLAVAGGKLWMSRPNGDVAFSATGNPRVWNTKTANDLLDAGIEYCHIVEDHSSGASVSFVSPFTEADFALTTRVTPWQFTYRYWTRVAQTYDGDGWSHLPYAGSGGISGDREMTHQVNGTRAQWTIRWDAATTGGIVRVKAITNNPGAIQSGLGVTLSGGAGGFTIAAGKQEQWNYTLDQASAVNVNLSSGNGALLAINASQSAPQSQTGLEYPETATEEISGLSVSDVFTVVLPSTLPEDDDYFNSTSRYLYGIHPTFIWYPGSGGETIIEKAVQEDDQWHANQDVAVALIAGDGDAGWLEPQANATVYGQVLSMTALRNRLAIHYTNGTVLYTIDPDPANMRFLDFQPIGANNDGRTVPLAGMGIFQGTTGFRGFDLNGDVNQFIVDRNLGEPLDEAEAFTAVDAVHWPQLGLAVFTGTLDDRAGDPPGAFILKISRESKIISWAVWSQDADAGPAAWGADHHTMNAVDDRLYWRSGNDVYWFDAGTTPGRDHKVGVSAVEAVSYTAVYEPNMTDLGQPALMKELFALDVVQEGSCTYQVQGLPFNRDAYVAGADITGTTYGQEKVYLAGTYMGVALRFEDDSDADWVLHGFTIEFKPWRSA